MDTKKCDNNRYVDRTTFYNIIDSPAKYPNKNKIKFGLWQWADCSYNIIDSRYECPNHCIYCYVKPMNKRFKRGNGDIEDLGFIGNRHKFPLNKKRVSKNWSARAKPKRYMFPSSHDLFPEMIDDYINVVRKMINAGHTILCVTKPRYICIKKVCDALKDIKDKFIFRFTIGATSDDILSYWEPYAPLFSERLKSLQYAHGAGYTTSVSMEPLLEEPDKFIRVCDGCINDSIWIGSINHTKQIISPGNNDKRLNNDRDYSNFNERLNEVMELFTPQNCMDRIQRLRDNDKVFWKKEIMYTVIKSL